MKRSICRVLLDHLGYCVHAFTDFPALADNYLFKVFPPNMMPQGKLADPSHTVDTEYRRLIFQNLDPAHAVLLQLSRL